jgi:hypothetical protein
MRVQHSHRVAVLLLAALPMSLYTAAQETRKVLTLEDYPESVVQYILADFDAHRSAVRERGAPSSIEALIAGVACPDAAENAFALYDQAAKAARLSERLNLLCEASALPCYALPMDPKALKHPVKKYNVVDVDLLGRARDATRLLTNEVCIQLAAGNADDVVTYLCGAFGLVDHLTQPPLALVQLTRYACQEMVVSALGDALSHVSLSGAQLERLAAVVDRAYHPDALARTFIFEQFLYPETDPFSSAQSIYLIDARSRAQLLVCKTALAVERYRQVHGAAPGTLDQLVPAFLAAVPADPMDGAPLRYANGAVLFAVFSVGEDGMVPADPLQADTDGPNRDRTMLRIAHAKLPADLVDLNYAPLSHVGGKNTRKEKAAINAVIPLINTRLLKGAPDLAIDVIQFSAGPLEDGIAVLLEHVSSFERGSTAIPVLAAFWYSKGSVYAVNVAARAVTRDLPAAPETITLEAVRDVVH